MPELPLEDRQATVRSWVSGNRAALDALIPSVYEDLRRFARRSLRQERRNHTLQTTALVHEAYLRLVGQREVPWDNRAQFLGLAAQMMRRILVNHAEAHRAQKRGGAEAHVSVDDADPAGAAPDIDVIALHHALEKLSALDARQGQIVELRYFGGVSIEEIARMLDISVATVNREYASARRWLYKTLATTGAADER